MAAEKEDFEQKPKFFLGCNSFADYEIGRVLDTAEKYAKDAVIIYTSYHGNMMYSHSLQGKGPAMYEEITHIPLIVKGFGRGKTDANPVSHINLAPTIMELFSLQVPKVFEGKSILLELKDGRRINEYIFMEFGRYEVDHDGFGGYQPVRAVFDGRYKLIINLLTSGELYDLKEDRQEMHNLINDSAYDEIKKKLHRVLIEQMDETRDPFRGYCWEDRPWDPVTRI